jgi:hypothetical protein
METPLTDAKESIQPQTGYKMVKGEFCRRLESVLHTLAYALERPMSTKFQNDRLEETAKAQYRELMALLPHGKA